MTGSSLRISPLSRWALPAALLLSLLAMCSPAQARVQTKGLAHDLYSLLVERDLQPSFVGACRGIPGKQIVECKWYAEGVWEDTEPYFCKGLAHYRPRRDRWRIQACHNEHPQVAPLSEEAGPPPIFGYNEVFKANSPEVALLAQSGSNAARRVINWTRVESKKGSFDWSLSDHLYVDLLAIGVQPLWIVTSAPCWAAQAENCKNSQASNPPAAEHVDDFARFAAKVAKRYPQSLGVEIWNEENFSMFWRGQIDPALYAQMLARSAEEIHAVNPSMNVVLGGLAALTEHSAGPDDMPFAPYLAELYRRGAMDDVDAIAYHPYPGGGPETDFLRVLRIEIGNLLDVLEANGDDQRPIWITETGLSTTGPAPFSEAQQASGLLAIYDMFRHMPRVPVVILHRFVDQSTDTTDRESGYGVIRKDDLTPKPAFCAIAIERGDFCPF